MRQSIPVVLDTISALALAVWLGGLALCWLVLAPSLSTVTPHDVSLAAHLFVESLRRFSGVVEACGIVLAATQWALRRRYQRDRQRYVVDGARVLIMFIALSCAEFGRYVQIPLLLKTGAPSAMSVLTTLAMLQGMLLIVYTAMSVWLQQSRLAMAPAVASPVPVAAATPQPAVTKQKPVR